MLQNNQLAINEDLVKRLIAKQFPQWKGLLVRPVGNGGHDNRTFHLGQDMLVRMPSSEHYAAAVEKEQKWLPQLAPHLPVPIPSPLAKGDPDEGYPWKWSIYKWLSGEPATEEGIPDKCAFAKDLALFLITLQSIDPTGGPKAGPHSFYRGASLKTYDAETRQAITFLKDKIDTAVTTEIWETGMSTEWNLPPVWIHGDIALSNLLVQNGRLAAVIDFGQLAIGDPACDLAIAWMFFEGGSRDVFRSSLGLDKDTWARGRAWALWKALLLLSRLTTRGTHLAPMWQKTFEEVIGDYINRV